ncbi:MAG: hypothetical protein WAT68_02100 [Candidatus Nitrotoga sp.]
MLQSAPPEAFRFVPPPRSLFRYQRFSEGLRPVIVLGQLYYPLLHELNDPCEYCYRIDTSWDDEIARQYFRTLLASKRSTANVQAANPGLPIDAMLARMRSMPFEELFEVAKRGAVSQSDEERRRMVEAQMRLDAEMIGICCFTENGCSSYMSHAYADRHAGVCLEFSTSEQPFALAQPITYQSEPPTMRPIGDPRAAQRARMFVKSSEWGQEREWRMINHRAADGPIVSFPLHSLISLSLCPDFDSANLPRLRTWLDEREALGHPAIAAYRLARRQDSYELTREPIENLRNAASPPRSSQLKR